MKILIASCLLLLTVAAHAADLTGNWGVDAPAMIANAKAGKEYQEADAATRKQMDQALAMLPQMMAKVTFTFTDKSITLALATGEAKSIEVLKQEEVDGVITLTTKQDGKEGKMTVTMDGPDKMKLEMGGGQSFCFRRKAAN